MMLRSPTLRSALLGCLFVGLIPLTGIAEIELQARALAARDAATLEAYNLPPANFLRASTFGYNELAADMVWIRAINYFTDQLFDNKQTIHMKRYLDTIITLDDQFKEVYLFGPAMLLSVSNAKATDAEVLAAIDLLEASVKAFPDDWTFPHMLGSYYLFELKGQDKAEKDNYKRIGAEWIQRAALLGAKQPWLTSLAAKVLSEQGQRELGIRHLQEMYMATQSEKVRRQILMRLKSLKEEALASDLSRAGKTFVDEYKKSPLNFVSADLYILLSSSKPQAFSLD